MKYSIIYNQQTGALSMVIMSGNALSHDSQTVHSADRVIEFINSLIVSGCEVTARFV